MRCSQITQRGTAFSPCPVNGGATVDAEGNLRRTEGHEQTEVGETPQMIYETRQLREALHRHHMLPDSAVGIGASSGELAMPVTPPLAHQPKTRAEAVSCSGASGLHGVSIVGDRLRGALSRCL